MFLPNKFMRSLPIWSLRECKLYGDKRLFTRIGMEKAENI